MANYLGKTVALVSGGGSGLGLATVQRLLEKGAKGVVALDLKTPSISHPNLISRAGDVCNEESVEAALSECERRFGPPNAIINCAGIYIPKRLFDSKKLEAHPLEDLKRILDVNVVGTFNVSRLGAKYMVKNELEANGQKGVIVMTSSVAAFEGQRGQAAYAASKGAINGMTLAIARDLSFCGIRCVAIAPGAFNTPMVGAMPDQVKTLAQASTPCPRRLGEPDEYAHLVQSIIENPFLNGEVIRLDGAIRMQP